MADRMDIDLIRQLAELLDQTSLTEIEVEDEGVRIRVARTAAPAAAPAPQVVHHAAPLSATPPSSTPAPAETGASVPATSASAPNVSIGVPPTCSVPASRRAGFVQGTGSERAKSTFADPAP